MFRVFVAGFIVGFVGNNYYLASRSVPTKFQLAREVVRSLHPSWKRRRIICAAGVAIADLCTAKEQAIRTHVGRHVPDCVAGIVVGYLPKLLVKHDVVINYLKLACDAERGHYIVISCEKDRFHVVEWYTNRSLWASRVLDKLSTCTLNRSECFNK